MIEVQHLSRKYGDHYAVADVSFKAEPGRIYGFLGPNGAGKSTTMNMMTGYLAPTKGTVLIDGEDIMREPEAAKSRIGYLPEIPPVYADMTVEEYLRFAAALRKVPRKERKEAVHKAMRAADLEAMRDRLIRNLSKGYKQRVGLAQAIIADPPVIILDEPTAGLDPEQQREMFEYIRALKEDHTIILSSHILSDVSAVCDYVWILNEGRLVASDTPENLQRRMTKTQTIKVTVQMCDADTFKAAVEHVPHVRKVTMNGASSDALSAAIEADTTEDIRPQISQAIFGAGMTILSMTTEEKSLEDVFLSLTHDTRIDVARALAEPECTGPDSMAADAESHEPAPISDEELEAEALAAAQEILKDAFRADENTGEPAADMDADAAGALPDQPAPENMENVEEDNDAGNI